MLGNIGRYICCKKEYRHCLVVMYKETPTAAAFKISFLLFNNGQQCSGGRGILMIPENSVSFFLANKFSLF